MSAPRLLLLGPNGQVGWELRRALAPLGELIALDRDGRDGLHGDLGTPGKLAQTVHTLKPDAVVNAAAYTAVDRAEQEADTARQINAHGPQALAEACRETGSLLVHYSTDYVFDGSGTAPWREGDPTDPLNLYGKTKLAGETAIRAASCRHLIFRTSWVYAARGRNFLRTMLRLAAERDALQVVDDQHGAPTGAELIADVTAQALHATLRNSTLDGTYHLTARGQTTWHGYARHLITEAREAGYPIRVTDDAITPVPSEAFPTPAARPRNSRLDVSELERAFGLRMPPWEAGVERVVSELVEGDGIR
ncbi:dTDP-4-dehydrorhamnose reductase [Sediminicurvatus halobius]|uniref:dTDP-4-dehydrorhamnose reductase n=1 Tax=Sediminicurvatus halobius TaxID=2182432 RepID=A0A2U2MX70_9GAMM|nr:dTDP-4-dehydrorhamnose reductase [Spiribacter halobius]PWG61463.1 dTDP-4-dehydrorhamnose reductase [Spiribacter halobius]UEX77248.1 dTDP-4-dehydrorhamnose reductase [Spiribacter halobius]